MMLGENTELRRVVRTVHTPFEPNDLRTISGCTGRVLSLIGLDMTISFVQLPKLTRGQAVDIDGWKWFVHDITADKMIFRLRGVTLSQAAFVTDMEA